MAAPGDEREQDRANLPNPEHSPDPPNLPNLPNSPNPPNPPDPENPSSRRIAADYASLLLRTLPPDASVDPSRAAAGDAVRSSCPALPERAFLERHPALEWAHSGAMALTGPCDGPPRLAPGYLATCCRGAGLALRELSIDPWPADFDAPALLGERAAIAGLTRRGSIAPGGSCRFVRCADGWIAVNLARPDDRELLPAWLAEGGWRGDPQHDFWHLVALAARNCRVESLVARGRLLGLPVADSRRFDGKPDSESGRGGEFSWCRSTRLGVSRERSPLERPLVLDLSSLWAGPLCSHLLSLAGARVIKLESRSRPDGARFGPAAFFDLMNGGKQSVALDFACPADLKALHKLLRAADIVVESSRPRALQQLGIDAEASLRQTPGQVWLSLTGYGRRPPEDGWVAFGDDAAVAAGLLLRGDCPATAPMFCGDAIADPLAGLHAAVAALGSWRAGGGVLLDVALRDVVRHTMTFDSGPSDTKRDGRARQRPVVRPARPALAEDERSDVLQWEVVCGGDTQAVQRPRARKVAERALPLGADTVEILREFAARC